MTPYYSHSRRIRVRSVAVDDTGDEPKLVYVYADAKTEDDQSKLWLSVDWDTGGMSSILNDHNVKWLDEPSP